MGEFNAWSILAGLVAYGIGMVLGTGPLIFGIYKFNNWMTPKINEGEMVRGGHRSVAIEFGMMLVCQAILIRHAVYAVTEVIRSLFIYRYPLNSALWLLFRCSLFVLIITSLALFSIRIAEKIFKRFARNFEEGEEFKRDNVAEAIFLSLVMLAIAIVLNEGMENFSRALISFGRTGHLG